MTEPDAAPRRTSSAISGYARTARRAVQLQLLVAGLALIATVVFAFLITSQTEKLNALNRELDTSSARLATTDNATQAVLQAASALASGDAALYSAAIDSLRAVRRDLALVSAEFEDKDASAAIDQLDSVRFSVTRTLASALYTRPERTADELTEAIALETENLAHTELDDGERYASTVALAAYHCAAGDMAGAKTLLDASFLAANPAATREGMLLDACDDLFDIPEAAIAAFDATTADPAFRVRRIFLHIVSEKDRAPAQALGRALCAAGYTVPRLELVSKSSAPKDSQIRYYYPPQASEAEWIASRFSAGSNPVWSWPPPAIRQLTGFDNLDPQNIEIWLQDSPQRAGAPPAPQPVEGKFSCTPAAQASRADVASLATQLSSDDKASRLSAGQQVADLLRASDDSAIVAALIAQLQPPRLDQLSASGRLNVLYMLNIESGWQARPEAAALRDALAAIRARAGEGVAIGGQTNDCLTKLETKLNGGAAPDRCGGL
ncbi:MAG: hypothetical protein R3C46_03965 [Hyphomonadaceae bacterium]